MRSKEEDVSILEDEARQILAEGLHSAEGRTLRRETQSIKSNITTLLQSADDRILRIHQAASNCTGIILEIQHTIDSFRRKEALIGRRPLLIDTESVDDEINHISSLRRQIDNEADAMMMKVDAEVSDVLPAEIEHAVKELESVKTHLLVRLI